MSSSPLIGRDDELAKLERLTLEFPIVSILGPGGIGKTRLAKEFTGDAVWVELHGVTRAAEIEARLHRALDTSTTELSEALSERAPACIVFDDLESGVAAVPQTLGRYCQTRPDITWIATSRHRLGLTSEATLWVGPLPSESPDSGGPLLLEWHLRRRGVEVDADLRVEIARRLDGIPLAIELAAAYVEVMGARALLDRLASSGIASLRSEDVGLAPRHRSLAAAFRASWESLDSRARNALAAATIFEASFDAEAFSAVASPPDGIDILRGLVDRSMIARLEDSPPRFRIFGPIRELAGDRLRDPEGLKDRYLEYVTRCVESHPLSSSAELKRHARYHGADLASIQSDPRANAPAVVRAAALATYGEDAIDISALTRIADRIVDEDVRGPAAVRVLLARARIGMRDGSPSDVLPVIDHAEAIAEDRLERAVVSEARASVARMVDDPEDALSHYDRALEMLETCDEPALEGGIRANRAAVYWEVGRREDAHSEMERALELHREGGDHRAEGILRSNLGVMLHHEGKFDEARHHHHEALLIHRRVGNQRFEAFANFDLGALAHEEGRFEAARKRHLSALERLTTVADRRHEDLVMLSLEAIRAALGHTSSGIDAIVARFESNDDPVFAEAARYYIQLAEAYRALGRAEPPDTLEALPTDRPDEVLLPARVLMRLGSSFEKCQVVRVWPGFGQFETPGHEIADIENRTALRSLFAHLVRRRLFDAEVCSREELIDAGWPDEIIDDDAATNRLHVALSSLRRMGLKSILETVGSGYRLSNDVLFVGVPETRV